MDCKFVPTDFVSERKPHLRLHVCQRAECDRAIFLRAGGNAGRVLCKQPHMGAGDAVAKVASAIGIKPTKWCNCEKRRVIMNALLPDIGKPSIVSWLQGKTKTVMVPRVVRASRGILGKLFGWIRFNSVGIRVE